MYHIRFYFSSRFFRFSIEKKSFWCYIPGNPEE